MKAILLLFVLQLTIAHIVFSQQDTLPAHVYNLAKLPVTKDSSRYRVQVMDGSSTTLANLEMHVTTLEPGNAAHPPHTHTDQEELIIVKEGLLNVTIQGKQKLLSPGGVALALPGEEHGAVNAGKSKAVYYLLKFKTKAPVNIERGIQAGGSILIDWNEVAVEKTAKGERRQFFNRPTALFEKFEMHVTTLNKGEISHLPHTHRQEEIILLRKGNISMQIADKFYPAAAGDIIFLSSNIPHALKNTGTTPTTYFAFQWQ
jgi:(S)-ureidoglycine aminohydrolase